MKLKSEFLPLGSGLLAVTGEEEGSVRMRKARGKEQEHARRARNPSLSQLGCKTQKAGGSIELSGDGGFRGGGIAINAAALREMKGTTGNLALTLVTIRVWMAKALSRAFHL
eukprot:2689175-Pleurochrysis_carterae.AAC.2